MAFFVYLFGIIFIIIFLIILILVLSPSSSSPPNPTPSFKGSAEPNISFIFDESKEIYSLEVTSTSTIPENSKFTNGIITFQNLTSSLGSSTLAKTSTNFVVSIPADVMTSLLDKNLVFKSNETIQTRSGSPTIFNFNISNI